MEALPPLGWGAPYRAAVSLRGGYLLGGARIDPIELESAGYPLGGISYRAPVSCGAGANSYSSGRPSSP